MSPTSLRLDRFRRLFLLALALLSTTVLAAQAPCARDRILFLTDSHGLGPFGEAMNRWLLGVPEAELQTYALGGSSPPWWYRGTVSPHAFTFNSCDGRPLPAGRPVADGLVRAPSLETLISEGDGRYRRQIVILEQGGNVPGLPSLYREWGARMVKAILSRPHNVCVWIAPPKMAKVGAAYSQKVFEAIRDGIADAAGDLRLASPDEACLLVDSRPVSEYPGGDGYHYPYSARGIEAARKWADAVIQAIRGRVLPVADVEPVRVDAPARALAADHSERRVVLPSGNAWLSINERHWQKEAPGMLEPVEETDRREGTRGECRAPGMVEVKGEMKLDRVRLYGGFSDPPGSIEALQKTKCVSWITRKYPERCAQFDKDAWESIAATLSTKPLRFCMDRFEYPNVRGANPVILIRWGDARALCEKQGKRLCTEEEWTFACEGEEALPYPSGYARSPEKCNIDHPWRQYSERNMHPVSGDRCAAEMDKLWQGQPSGSMPGCRSPFGVYDLTGNVDEWTVSSRPGGLRTILKGGYWGPVRTRCRPSTRSHDENHAFYQQGFRCCSDE